MKSLIVVLLLIAVVPSSTATDNTHQLGLQSQNEKNDNSENIAIESSTIASILSSSNTEMVAAVESSNLDDRSLSTLWTSVRVTLESMQLPNQFLGPNNKRSVFSRERNVSSNDSRNWNIILLQDDLVKIESIRFPDFCLCSPNPSGRIRIRRCSNHNVTKREWKVILFDNMVVAFESVAFPGVYIDNNERTRATTNIDLAKFEVTILDEEDGGGIILQNVSYSSFESVQFPEHFLATKNDKKVFTTDRYFGEASNNSRNWNIIDLGDNIVKIESLRFPGFCLMSPGGRASLRGCDQPDQDKRKWRMIYLDSGVVAFESLGYPGSYLDDAYKPGLTPTPREWKLV